MKISYATNHGIEKYTTIREIPGHYEFIRVVGDLRDFAVGRDSARSEYALYFLGTFNIPEKNTVSRHGSSVAKTLFSIEMTELTDDLVSSPDFKIQEITREDRHDDGERLLRVKFTYNPRDQSDSDLDGWMVLDSGRSWVIKEYHVTRTSPKLPGYSDSITATIHYKHLDDHTKIPVPEEITISMHVTNRIERTHKYIIDHWIYDSIPPAEFTLAAYGLGHLDWSPQPRERSGLVRWALGIVAAAIVIGGVLKYRDRQRRRQSSP